jgi:phosphopantothenoylcysteine decarboxylase/phosphopantothenate--cysteine ligase
MNPRMWSNPIVRQNAARLRDAGFLFIGPAAGWMACRTVGEGRMSEPEEIVERAVELLRAAAPKAASPVAS